MLLKAVYNPKYPIATFIFILVAICTIPFFISGSNWQGWIVRLASSVVLVMTFTTVPNYLRKEYWRAVSVAGMISGGMIAGFMTLAIFLFSKGIPEWGLVSMVCICIPVWFLYRGIQEEGTRLLTSPLFAATTLSAFSVGTINVFPMAVFIGASTAFAVLLLWAFVPRT